jgi:predicted ABC-type ATPase
LSELIIIAGPNGSGKSTITKTQKFNCPIIDPDAIAREISQESRLNLDRQAGKIALERWDFYLTENLSFAVETTLSGKTYLKKMKDFKERGWSIHLFFIGLESPDLNILRVAERVRKGSHDVPIEDIRRRYQRSMKNLQKATLIADISKIYDNSTQDGHELIATIEQGKITLHSSKCPQWFQQAMSLQQ